MAVCRYPCRKGEIPGFDSVVPMVNSDVHKFQHPFLLCVEKYIYRLGKERSGNDIRFFPAGKFWGLGESV